MCFQVLFTFTPYISKYLHFLLHYIFTMQFFFKFFFLLIINERGTGPWMCLEWSVNLACGDAPNSTQHFLGPLTIQYSSQDMRSVHSQTDRQWLVEIVDRLDQAGNIKSRLLQQQHHWCRTNTWNGFGRGRYSWGKRLHSAKLLLLIL